MMIFNQKVSITVSYFLVLIFISCNNKPKADLIFTNASVYTLDSINTKASLLVVKNGYILATGNIELLEQYNCDSVVDLKGKFIYPGFIDAHSHFYGLGVSSQQVDLTGTKSWDEVIERCKEFVALHHPNCLRGRGWDQNDWTDKQYPTNETLNNLFPNIPVLLKRVDGHAAIANNKALQLAKITSQSKIVGGEILVENNKPTGVLIDNAVDLILEKLPQFTLDENIASLKQAQKICSGYGLTSVCDAGLETDIINIIDSLQKAKILQMRVYAMVSTSYANLKHWLNRQPLKTDYLNVSAFKLYADGSLGSRGACLLSPYNDQTKHFGFLLTPKDSIVKYITRIANSPYQLCTHCIGDSANRLILNYYAQSLGKNNNRRWRIEHAQVVNEKDFTYFGNYGIIPSVQPVHATSDMYWAEKRIGKTRMQGAYALQTLLKQNGWLPLGTDFPVESPNPLHTFYAAIARMDANQFPPGGFQNKDALTREEALKGITIWAAKAAFEENQKGSLEAGKFADFVVMDVDLMMDTLEKIRDSKVLQTYIGGTRIYSSLP